MMFEPQYKGISIKQYTSYILNKRTGLSEIDNCPTATLYVVIMLPSDNYQSNSSPYVYYRTKRFIIFLLMHCQSIQDITKIRQYQ